MTTSVITPEEIIKKGKLAFKKTENMTDKALSYCPGCGHGVAHRLVMEVVEEMGITEDTIGVAPVGCSVLAYEFMNVDMQQAA
ncbi:MAG: 2-oxoglutarate oxidoreductase, partial [Bacteroidota bacterium]